MNKNYYRFLFVFLILVILFFSLGNFLRGGGESGLPFYNFRRMFSLSEYSWSSSGLGNVLSIGVASKPLYWVLMLLQNLKISSTNLENLFFVFISLSSVGAVFLLMKELFPDVKKGYVVLACIVYCFNPFTAINVWNRFLYNYMVFWAIMPLALFLFIKGLKMGNYVYAILTSLSTVLFSYAFTSIPFNLILWFVFLYTAAFFVYAKKQCFSFAIKYFFITVICFLLFNFWWISQFISSLYASSFSAGYDYFSTTGNISSLITISQKHGNVLNLITLLPGDFSTYWMEYYKAPIFFEIVLFFSFVILFMIKQLKTKWQTLYLGGLFIVSIFLMKGTNPPFGELFGYFFSHVPALQVFRNPFEKFGFILSLSYSVLFGYVVGEFIKRVESDRVKKYFLIFTSLYAILFLGYPFWTKRVFTSGNVLEGSRSYEVKVPSYYKETNEWLLKQESNFRFVSLPIDGEGMTYTWEKPYSGVELSTTLFDTPNISFNTTIPYYNVFVSEFSKYQLSDKAFSFYPFASVKNILVREDVDYQERRIANPKTVLKRLEGNKKMAEKVYKNGALTVYDLNQKYIWPKIYTTNNLLVTNSSDLFMASQYIDDFPMNKSAIFNYNGNLEELEKKLKNKAVIFPNKVYSPIDMNAIRGYTEEDIIARLFYVRHLPTSGIYPLILLKEKISSPSSINHEAWLIYQNGILGKRAVEIYKLVKGGANNKIVQQSEERYVKQMEYIKGDLVGYVDNSGPIGELLRNSLLFQEKLLTEAGADLSLEHLHVFIHEVDLEPYYLLPDPKKGMEYIIYSYNIVDGKLFQVNFSGLDGSDQLYVDGVLYEKGVNLNTSKFYLGEGRHEIALLKDTTEVNSKVMSNEGVSEINENNNLSLSIDIPDEPVKYKLSFDYKFLTGNVFQITFGQDVDSSNSKLFSQKITKDKNSEEWKNYKATFTTTNGSEEGVLSFDKVIDDVCKSYVVYKKCESVGLNYSVEIRNLVLEYGKTPDIVLVSGELNQKSDILQSEVFFNKIDPTKYVVRINKPDSKPEMLIFSELFSSEWRVEYADGVKVPDKDHYLVNVYANGWLVDREGSYEITIRYAPQDLMEVGKRVSLISIIVGVCFVLVLSLKKRLARHV